MASRRRPIRSRTLLLAAIALACAGPVRAQTGVPAVSPTPSVAEYVPGFIQYVRWPAETDLAQWQACVPAELAESGTSYAGRFARGKPIQIRPIRPGDSLADCQILDLTAAPAASVKALLPKARRQAILTVGDGDGFCTAGGVICLRTQEAGGGFEVNLSAVQESGLNANAKLLLLGRKRQTAGGGS